MTVRKMKSNDLGIYFEKQLSAACFLRPCGLFRLHTVRSFRGVSNPCDFIIMDKNFTALVECKATNRDHFSCADFYQLKHFEEMDAFDTDGHYGVIVYFHSNDPSYVYVSGRKILENRTNRRPIRVATKDSYDFHAKSIDDLLNYFV